MAPRSSVLLALLLAAATRGDAAAGAESHAAVLRGAASVAQAAIDDVAAAMSARAASAAAVVHQPMRLAPQPQRRLLSQPYDCSNITCMATINNAMSNVESWMSITNASQCPVSAAYTTACYYNMTQNCIANPGPPSPPSPPAGPCPPPSTAPPSMMMEPPSTEESSTPLCATLLVPNRNVTACLSGVAVVAAYPTVTASMFNVSKLPAAPVCKGHLRDVLLSFPCFRTLMLASTATGVNAMLAAPPAANACPTASYTCNCLATLFTTCPLVNMSSIEMLVNSSSSSSSSDMAPSSGGGCMGSNSDSNTDSSSDSSMASSFMCNFTSVLDSAALNASRACPANVGSGGAWRALTTAAALTAPVITAPTLPLKCYATLGLPLPPPTPSPPPPSPAAPPAVATAKPVAAVAAAVTLGGVTAAQFSPSLQTAFVTGVANTLSIAAADVSITSFADSTTRRRLTAAGLRVNFAVAAPTTASVSTLSTAITAMTTTNAATFTTQLNSAGLTQVSSVALATPPAQAPAPAASGAARAAATVLVAVAAAAALL